MTTETTKVPYTQSAASLEVPPPYRFPGVSAYAFVWEAQMEPIQAFCDKFLNLGTCEQRGFVYKPAPFWPFTMLLFIDYPHMISTCPKPGEEMAYGDRGYVKQTEVLVALPVVRTGVTNKTRLLDAEFEWGLPFIVVADAMSAVSGREMVGLPKLLATIQVNEVPGSFTGTVDMLGWPDDDPDTMQQTMPFLTVTALPSLSSRRLPKDRESPWTALPGRLGGLLVEGLALTREIADAASLGMMPMAMQMVSLRQYRDALCVEKAVYQDLVTCRFTYMNIRNLQFYNEKYVTIDFNNVGSFSEIIRSFLVVKGKCPAKFSPTAAFRFDADMDFDDMRTVRSVARDDHSAKQDGDATSAWVRAWQGFWPPRS
jgi:hypothetical protein